MRRYLVAVVAGLLVGAFVVPPAAFGAPPETVGICHWQADSGTYKALTLPARAAAQHLAKHAEDVALGDGMDENCESTEPTPLAPGCYTNGTLSYDYDGEVDTHGNAVLYGSVDCTGVISTRVWAWVQADEVEAAAAVCEGLLTSPAEYVESIENLSDLGYGVPADHWVCRFVILG